jgi:hypothetical protein
MANLHPVVGFHDEEDIQEEKDDNMTDDGVVQLCICFTLPHYR